MDWRGTEWVEVDQFGGHTIASKRGWWLGKDGCSRGSEEKMDRVDNLGAEAIGLADGLHISHRGERSIRGNAQGSGFHLNREYHD